MLYYLYSISANYLGSKSIRKTKLINILEKDINEMEYKTSILLYKL